jgi:hypothetical protein
MKTLLPLAWASAWNRRLSLTLAALSIALAVALLLSVTRAREAAQTHFAQSVAGVDLVVGPAAARCSCSCTPSSTWETPAMPWTGRAIRPWRPTR